ncbi:MAG: hypothetical protein LBS32_05430 [Clostridiales Family XIII bacterium]|jgi:flagellar basal-body rod modification protein FlgD|nr:hypothetical protein [Clostridiales Family XIII bacterium]
MATDGISFIDSVNATATSSASSSSNSQDLSMEDFFQLMVAQLQNQDMFSPMDNSQFVSQMAQFSMVNALMDMAELSSVSYSTSLIGKYADVAFVDDEGQMGTDYGLIEAVNLYNGAAEVVINGSAYALSNVMTVSPEPIKDGALPLLENAALIGRTASLLHTGTDGTIESVLGVITGLRLVDGEVYAQIGGRSFALSEITSLSETAAGEGTQNEGE